MDHNPELKPWRAPSPNQEAGKGVIEKPGQARNLVWQTRSATPTAYENQVADALESVFESGAESLDAVVAKLNELGVRTPEGGSWTPERFTAEMKRLGA